ncbi:hypothetical protein BK133_11055 [Paenibacillus sp. FSL H8-0548]|uniref:hypothetical protein n=1 Tax=Paenibacillus sp. FSL H8-0548 TaxID=1920422 RepID=UPI00096C45EB|nr:hypothetical protein [Paenibacillus sp. FSL H8-0548]OMF35242.1 hypothetical protein BK133_11055 [Paenibacillus sp. FSL H8-0548]
MTTAEIAAKMIAAAKRDTKTFGEALINLGPASIEVAPMGDWPAFDTAMQTLMAEMKAQPHGGAPACTTSLK